MLQNTSDPKARAAEPFLDLALLFFLCETVVKPEAASGGPWESRGVAGTCGGEGAG